MKTILVPTDYSANATNAAVYAVEIAKRQQSKIIFLNVVEEALPIMNDEEEKEMKERLKRAEKDMMKSFENEVFNGEKTGLEIEYQFAIGNAVEGICRAAENAKADLIVMGIKCEPSLQEHLFGSVTTGVIRNSKVPVLSVPEFSAYANINKIVFACDEAESLTDELLINVKELAMLFNAQMVVLKVFRFPELLKLGNELKGLSELKHKLEGIDLRYEYVVDGNVNDGIEEYAKKEGAGLIIMAPKKHGIIYRLIIGSQTKRMAFDTTIPLLTLPVHKVKVPVYEAAE